MSSTTNVFEAACKSGQVTINGVKLPGAKIISAGQAQSQGIAILCGGNAFYVAIPVDTLKTLIALVSTMSEKIVAGINPSNAGGPITSGTFAADLAQIKVQLEALKGDIQ